MSKQFFFQNIDKLVEHILFQFPEIGPLKLQKGLYFLFAFYINTYSVEPQTDVIETENIFPKYLFQTDFEAWTYGPVIRDVYLKFKEKQYTPHQYQFSEKDKEIEIFINNHRELQALRGKVRCLIISETTGSSPDFETDYLKIMSRRRFL